MVVPLLLLCLQEPSPAQTAVPAAQANAALTEPRDLSDYLGFLVAAHLGGGLNSTEHQPSVFGGIKIGLPIGGMASSPVTLRTVTLDVGYDRIQSRHGFSGEVSMMLPAARFPTPRTSRATYARVYVEPGVGWRAGGGEFGNYASAKAMLVLFSDDRLTLSHAPPSFFLEIQRRFPLMLMLHGDTRLTIGLMVAVCNHCGLN